MQITVQVPLLDLPSQYASIKDEVLAAVEEVLVSQVCIGGPKVTELERQVADLCGCRFAVGMSSGTDALLNAMMSLGIGPSDEVITTPFTFFATVGCILRVGAQPVFIDIDPKTYNMDPNLLEGAITSRTKAIVPVHLFGQMCDMDPIMRVAEKRALFVIEDAAQAISATYKGRSAGSIGIVGCLSFFPSKNLGAAGDAGMILTNDEALYDRVSIMRVHGAKPKYYHKYIGGNFRLDPIQAAILLVKLRYLNEWSCARRHHAAYYNQRFHGTIVGTPHITPDCITVVNQYVIRVPHRNALITHLRNQGIGCEVYYPLSMHLQQCLSGLGYRRGDFPESEKAQEEVLSIPVYPELTDDMKEYVADTILDFYR
jgi:dTDP-4-amino-4,6-dideoxygalactose transaminase